MKKYILTILLLLSAGMASAKPVDPAVARRVAENLLHMAVVDATPASFTHCYLFTGADGKGFALIAADDCVRPILGYSSEDRFFPSDTDNLSPKPLSLPQHIAHWINAYQLNIASLADAGAVASPRVQAEWESLLAAKFHRVRDHSVAPLVTTRWNQGYPYNILCPFSVADSAYSVTGCVATATAQLMKYWNHPAVGRGAHAYGLAGYGSLSANFDTTHYDWAHMPDAPGATSSDVERQAVALLMYHVGVAVEMNYSPHSSGAFVTSDGNAATVSSENALKNYFRYNQGLFSAAKINYTDTEWDALLTAEIDALRPMVVSGHDNSGGHAFVLDGYDSLGFFHVNWGWGGYCDGYYTLDSLNPDGSGIGGNATNGYNNDNKVLLHVYPASENASVTVSVASSDTLMGHVSGGGTFAPYAHTTLVATATEGHRFLRWKSGNVYNPFALSPNTDFADTALFVPLQGDTLGYCFSGFKALWGEYAGTPCEWGIRLPASAIAPHRQLEAVQLYGVSNADYTLKVYRGASPDVMIYTASFSCTDFGWKTIPLSSPIAVYDDTPLWIVFTSSTYTNPATVSNYSGNPDGTWYKRQSTTWEHLETRGEYYSWMIRALFGSLSPVDITVISSDEAQGTVSGSGSYYPGDTALLVATPAAGYRFVGWSNGVNANPYHYPVTTSTTIVGSFVPAVGIDGDAEFGGSHFKVDGLLLAVDNPAGESLALYDIQGRLLSRFEAGSSTFSLPSSGVYLLRCGASVRKIVATP